MMNPIRTLREKRGLRQLDVALLLGVSEMSVSHWERGARIPDKELDQLAKILGIPPDTLERGLKAYTQGKREELEEEVRRQESGKEERVSF